MFEMNNYLKSLPHDYKADHGFKDWLHDVTDIDTMRNIIMTVEKRIKRIVGHRDVCLPHIDEKNWKILNALIKVRQNNYDDSDTWTDGALLRPAFKSINVCYVLHALCCHFHYSLADVLRMNGFSLVVQVAYDHIYK